MFDDIYCTFLDRKYFGRESLEDGVSLLPQEELDELEGFVRVKMQQAGKSRLDEHLSYDALISDFNASSGPGLGILEISWCKTKLHPRK